MPPARRAACASAPVQGGQSPCPDRPYWADNALFGPPRARSRGASAGTPKLTHIHSGPGRTPGAPPPSPSPERPGRVGRPPLGAAAYPPGRKSIKRRPMKFTLSWLQDHLDTTLSAAAVADVMTRAGLEVEHVDDPGVTLAPFSVAKIVSTARHPDADRLQVCQVDTRDGRREIVCGAPNARAGLTTIYAPIGAYVPGLGVTLVEKPVRGVVSMGMLCSARELEVAEESDGIVELPDDLAVGVGAARAFSVEPVIDFEVTPNRPDWLGVRGIARDLAAAGAGRLKPRPTPAVAGAFPCPISVEITAPELCPYFAGHLVRGVRNGPSPAWLQDRLRSVGLRPINALVDVTNFLSLDRARPLHVYDAGLLVGSKLVVRHGLHADHGDEHLIALDGRRYDLAPAMCVIADAGGERPIDLGGVMGGQSTGCSEATTDVFIEAAYFDPTATAETGRALSLFSDAQYRFARGVDTGFVREGLDLATAMILELCGGEASQAVEAGAVPAPPEPVIFNPAEVQRLSGLQIPPARSAEILTALGFEVDQGAGASGGSAGPAAFWTVQVPTWRRDVDGPADLVEEVARIEGYDALPATPLPVAPARPQGVLNPLQQRVRTARRALAALGWAETVGWSFTSRRNAELFGGGGERLAVANPIAAELDWMRPSALPGLVEAAARNAARGRPDAALFEIGPVFAGDRPQDQATAVAALLSARPPRGWEGDAASPLFRLKGDLLALLETLGAPVASLQTVQGAASPWWHPAQAARLQLGPKAVVAEWGALHPSVLKAMDAPGPLFAFELRLQALPEPKRRPTKTRGPADLPALQPVWRDFAFVVEEARAAGELVRAAAGADKALVAEARVFDVYRGPGVPEGAKSVALEVRLQPRDRTPTDDELEAVCARIVAAVEKTGARLRS